MKADREPYVYMNDLKEFEFHYCIKPIIVKFSQILDYLLEETKPCELSEFFNQIEQRLFMNVVRTDDKRAEEVARMVRVIRKLTEYTFKYGGFYKDLVNKVLPQEMIDNVNLFFKPYRVVIDDKKEKEEKEFGKKHFEKKELR